jgi:hypothetical protein
MHIVIRRPVRGFVRQLDANVVLTIVNLGDQNFTGMATACAPAAATVSGVRYYARRTRNLQTFFPAGLL